MNWNKDWLIKTKIDIKPVRKIMDKIIGSKLDTTHKSTRGLNSTQHDLIKDQSKFEDVTDLIKNELCKLETRTFNLLSAWTVVGQENSYHMVHNHNQVAKDHVSTVLYLRMPKKKNIHQSGEFYYFLNDGNKITYDRFLPLEGTLVIMPVHILHGAYPQAKGIRQTLNFDFEVKNDN
jgi:hypothetical protein